LRQGEKMKKIYIFLLTAAGVFFIGGCREDLPAPNPDKIEYLRKKSRCSSCRKVSEIGRYERVNQALGRCPFCKKVVNVMSGVVKN